jgi:hypothetical protein
MQRPDGLFTGQMSAQNQLLYTHAQCAIACCELLGMTNDSTFRPPAQKAIKYAVDAQDKVHGGWRYKPNEDSDTSVTGWFVMALQSARMAKLEVPADSLKNVTRYLDAAQINDGRRYGYWLQNQPSSAVSAEGLLCRQYLGWAQTDERLVEGLGDLIDKSPIAYDSGPDHDVYYWYYATQAAHHLEGPIWEKWNNHMRQVVPSKQLKEGPEAGSWDPTGDKWGAFHGRLYMTCLSTYMLEVYYRHLPIYSGYKAFAEAAPPVPSVATEKAEAEKTDPQKTDASTDSPDATKPEDASKKKPGAAPDLDLKKQ